VGIALEHPHEMLDPVHREARIGVAAGDDVTLAAS
jgi:hypothetical protein